MKCRIPKQTMTVNVGALNATQDIRHLSVLSVLKNDFGFGEKRLRRFWECLTEEYTRFSKSSCLTDRKYRDDEMTNIDTAVINIIRSLDGIDWQDITGIDQIIIGNKDKFIFFHSVFLL